MGGVQRKNLSEFLLAELDFIIDQPYNELCQYANELILVYDMVYWVFQCLTYCSMSIL